MQKISFVMLAAVFAIFLYFGLSHQEQQILAFSPTNTSPSERSLPGFLAYENSISGIKIQYPANWHILEQGVYPIPFSNSANTSGTFIVSFEPADGSVSPFYTDVSVEVENLNPDTMAILESNTNANLAGNPASTFITDFSNNGTNYKKGGGQNLNNFTI